MFTKKHFEYLADTIINDTVLDEMGRALLYTALGTWFERDFVNFDPEKWRKRWTDHFH